MYASAVDRSAPSQRGPGIVATTILPENDCAGAPVSAPPVSAGGGGGSAGAGAGAGSSEGGSAASSSSPPQAAMSGAAPTARPNSADRLRNWRRVLLFGTAPSFSVPPAVSPSSLVTLPPSSETSSHHMITIG